MSRARYLKPTFFTNERIGELNPFERLAWQGLWCVADREGRLKDRPKSLKIEILPYDDEDFDAILEALAQRGFIVRYEVAGEHYISIPSFLEHQKPHPKEVASTIPAPPKTAVKQALKQAESASLNHASVMHEPSMRQPFGNAPDVAPLNGMTIKSESESAGGDGGDSDPPRRDGAGIIDIGFRERYGTMTTALGVNLTERLTDEFRQIAEEYTQEAINRAIGDCRTSNRRPYPSELRKHLPPLPNSRPLENRSAPAFDFEAYERDQAELSEKRRERVEARRAREAEAAPDDAS